MIIIQFLVQILHSMKQILSKIRFHKKDKEIDECFDKAINEAISKGILTDYLSRKGTKVKKMLKAEYNHNFDFNEGS